MSTLAPYFISFFAVVCYAALTPLAKKLQLDIPPFAFIGIASAILCALAVLISLCFEKNFSVLKLSPGTWMSFTIFALVNLAGYAFYLTAISKVPATQYQLIYLVSPIVTAFLAYVLLHEAFKLQYLYGLIFIGAGLFTALRGGTN